MKISVSSLWSSAIFSVCAILATLIILQGLAACAYPTPIAENLVRSEPIAAIVLSPTQPHLSDQSMDLRGNPSFSPDKLPPNARLWYDRLWAAIESPNRFPDPIGGNLGALHGDAFHYARRMNVQITAQLWAFRATGDLHLLDDVARITDVMRNGVYPDDHPVPELRGQKIMRDWGYEFSETELDLAQRNIVEDGYLNFVWLLEPNVYYLTDYHRMDEMLLHAWLAAVAYAFDVNRDLVSPNGYNYAERADFWRDYLQNDFEAKWRERSRRTWPRMDFVTRSLLHPHVQFIRYHYYMYRLTDDEEYLHYAEEKTRELFAVETPESGIRGFVAVETPLGSAYVWPHSQSVQSEHSTTAQPTTYGTYTIAAAIDLAFEGFDKWGASGTMEQFANTVAWFIIDKTHEEEPELTFAATVAGDHGAGGLAVKEGELIRWTSSVYSYNSLIFTMLWDSTGEIENTSMHVYQIIEEDGLDTPRRIHTPAAMLVNYIWQGL